MFRVVNPLHDIYFSQGPMDVLDHSSSRFSYGSKLGIDVTSKFKEESDSEEQNIEYNPDVEICSEKILKIPGVSSCNLSLLANGISAIILGIVKENPKALNEIVEKILSIRELHGVKLVVFVDPELNIYDLDAVCWYVSGNIDPRRDCRIVPPVHPGEVAHFIMDGTRKSDEIDGFKRDWPNPVVSSPETIARIDELWSALGLGPFIPSPSLKYIPLQRGGEAVSQ